jgi:hypothetical protein
MIDISAVDNTRAANSTESSNVLVRMSLDAGISAQWSRVTPKETDEQDTNVDATNNDSVQSLEVSSERSEDSDSAMLNLSSSSDTNSVILDIDEGDKEDYVPGSKGHETGIVCKDMNDIPVLSQNTRSEHNSKRCDNNETSDCDVSQPSTTQEEYLPTTSDGRSSQTKVPDCDRVETNKQSQSENELLKQEELSSDTVESIEMVATTSTMETMASMETMETSDTQPLIC